MGMHDEGSIHYGYGFEILNTFEMGLLKKTVFTHPVKNGPESDPWLRASCEMSRAALSLRAGYCRLVTRAPPLTPTLEEGDEPLRLGLLNLQSLFLCR